MAALAHFAGTVGHDVNNLLAVIVNYATFIGEEVTAAEPDVAAVARDLQEIVAAAQRGTEFTRRLLTFARRNAARTEPVRVDEVVAGAEAGLRGLLGPRVVLLVELEPDLPAVEVDPRQLRTVLEDLVRNAGEAMPDGGTVTLDVTRVPGLSGRPSTVRLRVVDTGVGMAPDVLERAFDPFFSTRRRGLGAGLGLATVYGIAVGAGGGLEITSEPGVGTTVCVVLPAAAEAGGGPAGAAGREPGGGGETVLVVEDEDALRKLIGRILHAAGYHVLTAPDGAVALELARSHPGPLDLLVTDMVMPGIAGEEVARRLTADRPDTPVLFVSGSAEPGGAAPGEALLMKPFSRADLLAAVRRRLAGRR
jgi:hypothetical protein